MAVSLDTLISRSVARLGKVHPSLEEYTVELIKRCYKEGIRVQISSGYRSFVDQAYIYGQGRSYYMYKGKNYGRLRDGNGKLLPVVSNAQPGESIHNYGIAIDYFIVTEDGQNSIWNVNADWKRVAAIAKEMGFEWGGDWSSFRDYPHLQFTNGLTLSQIAKGMRPTFPKLIKEEVTPVSKPKEEDDMLAKAIVINSFKDYVVAEVLAARLNVPIYPRSAIDGEVAKELIVVGGDDKGLKADKITNLSGATFFDTAANVEKYIK